MDVLLHSLLHDIFLYQKLQQKLLAKIVLELGLEILFAVVEGRHSDLPLPKWVDAPADAPHLLRHMGPGINAATTNFPSTARA